MKIWLANYEPGRIGGGWTFQTHFANAFQDNLSNYDEADIYFITSASIDERDNVVKAKVDGKKIVLRCDNIIRNSRNRNTGMTRMRDMADMADLVIYQSAFAMELLQGYLNAKNYTVIHNATNLDVFYPSDNQPRNAYLYAKSSSDETKNWEMARVAFQRITNPDKTLTIVGRAFDDKVIEYGFDFYMGEKVNYIGELVTMQDMANIYRQSTYLLYSFFNDACSNTLIEALASGLLIHDCYAMSLTGGTPEIKEAYERYGRDYLGLPRMAGEYTEELMRL